jgi:hypothetical protein
MDSRNKAISPFQAQDLLKNAGIDDPGVTIPGRLEQIMGKIKSDIEGMGSQGFTKNAMTVEGSPQYKWAHNTAPGIIWLWAQQDEDIRASWLITQKDSWKDFNFKAPSPDAPLYGFTPSVSTSPSASRASDSAAGTGAVSVPPFSFGLSPPPTSSAAALPSGFGSSPSPFPFGLSSDPSTLAHDSGPFSVPTTPTSLYNPPSPNDGGYRKRRTRKTRRKSSKRGRSRSRHIRRKKTHHRRHRR